MLVFIPGLLSRCIKEDEIDEFDQDRVARYIVSNIKFVDGEEIKIKIKSVIFYFLIISNE